MNNKDKKDFKDSREFKGNKGSRKKEQRGNNYKVPQGYNSANDFRWYYQNPQVAKDAASIQFATVLGLPSTLPYLNGDNPLNTFTSNVTLPGIMNISYVPTVGISNEGVADVNVAARLIYSYVRHANSGSRNYEASDLMTYLLAMGSAYAYYTELVKIYGLLNTTSVLNRYVSKAIVQASGYNYDELVNNMSDFRAFINWFAVKLNTFAVPKDMYLYDRWTFLPLHVFSDGVGSKVQFYNFCPQYLYVWSGTQEGGSALLAQRYLHTTFDAIKEFGRDIINALLDNEDIGLMSGDILKSFKESGLRVIGGIPDDYVTDFLRDEGVLSQIHNMTVAPGEIAQDSLNITQDNNVLVISPYVNAADVSESYYMPRQIMLDTWLVDPTPESVMEMTRLCSMWDSVTTLTESSNLINCTTCGSEIVTAVDIWYFDRFGKLCDSPVITYWDAIDSDGPLSPFLVALLTKFDWAPFIYYASEDHDFPPIGDTQNYTFIDRDKLNTIHEVALQSLLNVYGLYLKTV